MASNLNILIQAKDQASATLKRVSSAIADTGDAAKTTSGHLNTASDSSDRFGVSLGGVAKIAATVGLAYVAKQFFDLGKTAIQSAGEFEQSRVAFGVMLGSADKAKTLLQEISEFAKTTPFELPEVVSSSKQLLAYGFAQEQIIPIMRRLGDVAAGVGVPVSQLTTVFGQVRVAGKLMGQDLLQFTNAGVPMIEALAKTMGKPQEEIKKLVEKGEVGFAQVETALNSLTDSGGRFGGMMEQQSHTFNGVMSNISDGFGQVLRAAVGMDTAGNIVKNGLFDRVKTAAEAVMPVLQQFATQVGPAVASSLAWIDANVVPLIGRIVEVARQTGDYLIPKLDSLWQSINANVIPALMALWQNVIAPLIPVIGTALVGAIGAVVDVATALINGFSYVYQKLAEGNPIWWGVIGVLGTFAGALAMSAAISAFTSGMQVIMYTTIPAVASAFGSLSALIAAPLVMPAIAVGAALAAIATVVAAIREAQSLMSELDATQASVEGMQASNRTALERAQQQYKDGKITKDRLNAIIQNSGGYATGTMSASGGRTVIGENGPEIVDLPRGSAVTPSYRTRMSDIGQSGGVTNNLNGTFTFSTAESVTEFFNRLDQTARLARMGMGAPA